MYDGKYRPICDIVKIGSTDSLWSKGKKYYICKGDSIFNLGKKREFDEIEEKEFWKLVEQYHDSNLIEESLTETIRTYF